MTEQSPWSNRLATLTMALGLGSVVIGIAAWLLLSMELRLAFYIASVATGLALLACMACCNWSRFGIPAAGVVPLLLFWLCIGMQSSYRVSDGNMSRNQVLNNAKMQGVALATYTDEYKHLPTDTRNDAKLPSLSWRVSLLPFVDHNNLYKLFNLAEPWDSPTNKPLLEKNPPIYMSMYKDQSEETPWQGFVGPGTAFEPDGRKLSLKDDFPDGLQNTILIVETNKPVPWSKPADIAYGPDILLPSLGRDYYKEVPRPFSGYVRDPGFHVIIADGSVRFLSSGVSESVLRAMIVRNDGNIP